MESWSVNGGNSSNSPFNFPIHSSHENIVESLVHFPDNYLPLQQKSGLNYIPRSFFSQMQNNNRKFKTKVQIKAPYKLSTCQNPINNSMQIKTSK